MKPRTRRLIQRKLKRHSHALFLIAIISLLALLVVAIIWRYALYQSQARKITQAHTKSAQDEPLVPRKPTVQLAPVITTPLMPHDTAIPPIIDGAAPVISRLETKNPVVFLTIDDGAIKQQSEIDMVKDKHVKASLFLANLFIQDNSDFFKGFLPLGSLIEDHSITHSDFSRLSYASQK